MCCLYILSMAAFAVQQMTEFNSYNRGCVIYKASSIYYLSLYRKGC